MEVWWEELTKYFRGNAGKWTWNTCSDLTQTIFHKHSLTKIKGEDIQKTQRPHNICEYSLYLTYLTYIMRFLHGRLSHVVSSKLSGML